MNGTIIKKNKLNAYIIDEDKNEYLIPYKRLHIK